MSCGKEEVGHRRYLKSHCNSIPTDSKANLAICCALCKFIQILPKPSNKYWVELGQVAK